MTSHSKIQVHSLRRVQDDAQDPGTEHYSLASAHSKLQQCSQHLAELLNSGIVGRGENVVTTTLTPEAEPTMFCNQDDFARGKALQNCDRLACGSV